MYSVLCRLSPSSIVPQAYELHDKAPIGTRIARQVYRLVRRCTQYKH